MLKHTSPVTKLSALVLLGFLGSCDDKADDPKKNEETELITTATLHLTGPGGEMRMATWRDITPFDAAGRTIDTLFLDDSTVYSGRIELKDESQSPALDVTKEVSLEKGEHLFVYTQTPASPSLFSLQRTDKDAANLEVGLTFRLETNANKGVAALKVVLKHQPGEKDGTATPGETELDVDIPVKVR